MQSNKYLPSICLLFVFIVMCFFIPEDAIARAGGGSSKGGGILGLILWPFILIYSAIITYIAIKKNKQAKALIAVISKHDNAWDLDSLKARIDETYFKVQTAWRDRDQEIAKDCMSERLYFKHKAQTDDMLKRGIRNVMESINLKEAKIVEVLDYKDNSKDTFWAYIVGSMVDYTIVEKSGELIDGEKKNNSFKELWKFKRQGDTWLLDEIDQDVEISDLRAFNPFSEEALNK